MFGLRGLNPDIEIGGFDTAFSEIAPRLARRGHEVTIFCRRSAYSPGRRVPGPAGIRLIYVPSPGGKNFAAPVSTLAAVFYALAASRFDVWFFVNVGMGHHAALARLSRRPVVMNVDGLDWLRAKWGPLGRAYFRSAASAAVRSCTRLVTDCEAMRAYYLETFGRDSTMIAYGADIESSTEPERVAAVGVQPHDYYLIVSRLVPENSLDVMLEAFRKTHTARRLVVVGGANYHDAFHDRLRALARSDARIHLVGTIHDQRLLKELWCNSYAYLHGHSVGGTNPSLLRAMGYGACVLALDTVFNREALHDAGVLFPNDAHALAELIDRVDQHPEMAAAYRARGPARIRASYSWDRITDQYEQLFQSVAEQKSRLDRARRPRHAMRHGIRSRARDGRDLVSPRH